MKQTLRGKNGKIYTYEREEVGGIPIKEYNKKCQEKMLIKNRNGERYNRVKLSKRETYNIRRMLQSGKYKIIDIARKYEVYRRKIYKIKKDLESESDSD